MSTPIDRLIGDEEAERLERFTLDVLTHERGLDSAAERLALATLTLIRDRSARQELSVINRLEYAA